MELDDNFIFQRFVESAKISASQIAANRIFPGAPSVMMVSEENIGISPGVLLVYYLTVSESSFPYLAVLNASKICSQNGGKLVEINNPDGVDQNTSTYTIGFSFSEQEDLPILPNEPAYIMSSQEV